MNAMSLFFFTTSESNWILNNYLLCILPGQIIVDKRTSYDNALKSLEGSTNTERKQVVYHDIRSVCFLNLSVNDLA